MGRPWSIYLMMHAALFSICLAPSAQAQESQRFPGIPLIHATGRATQAILPDIFTMSATVETSGATPDESFAALAPKIEKLLQNVNRVGIEDAETKSTGPTSEVLFRHYYDERGQEIYQKREAIGYRAHYTLIIKSKKLEKPGILAPAIVAAGANINTLGYDVSNRQDLIRKLELAAVTDASERARQMILATGSKPGRILEIDPPSTDDTVADLNRPAKKQGPVDFSFALRPGTIDLEQVHTVTLEILPQQ